MPDSDHWNKLNEDCEQRAEIAVDFCSRSWGYGGPEAQWRMKLFADWLEELYVDIAELIEGNCLYEDTYHACMVACNEMISLDQVDQDRHMKYIVRIRYAINPDGYWTDWPYDISDLLESDQGSESGAIFDMEMDD